jgi:hypothetical protein
MLIDLILSLALWWIFHFYMWKQRLYPLPALTPIKCSTIWVLIASPRTSHCSNTFIVTTILFDAPNMHHHMNWWSCSKKSLPPRSSDRFNDIYGHQRMTPPPTYALHLDYLLASLTLNELVHVWKHVESKLSWCWVKPLITDGFGDDHCWHQMNRCAHLSWP